MEKVTNHKGIELRVGDKIIIISDKLGDRSLSTVTLGEVLTITGFSDNGKILYHHNSLALPINSNLYKKITMEKEFVTYIQAVDLKELGFDEPCFKVLEGGPVDVFPYEKLDIPLKQQAFRWFRDKHCIHHGIIGDLSNNLTNIVYVYTIFAAGRSEEYKTYEEAEQACLNKLIEICKNK
jgi:hypothetical protein